MRQVTLRQSAARFLYLAAREAGVSDGNRVGEPGSSVAESNTPTDTHTYIDKLKQDVKTDMQSGCHEYSWVEKRSSLA